MRDCSSRTSWNGPRLAVAVVLLLSWGAARRCLAGDSFLDRAAPLQEAIPYGTSIEPPAAPEDEASGGAHDKDSRSPAGSSAGDREHGSGTTRGSTSTTIAD